jgi:hypothetical protein
MVLSITQWGDLGFISALYFQCAPASWKPYWVVDYLRDTKEVLMLLPITKCLDTAAAVGTLFRNGDDKICLRQITKRCEVLAPIVIGMDYNGVFKNKNNE